MYNLTTTAKDTDDLSIQLDEDGNRRQPELSNDRTQEGKKVRIILKDVFSFAEQQEKATCRFGYKLTITRNSDNSVLNKNNAINNAKIKTIGFEWFVPH